MGIYPGSTVFQVRYKLKRDGEPIRVVDLSEPVELLRGEGLLGVQRQLEKQLGTTEFVILAYQVEAWDTLDNDRASFTWWQEVNDFA